MSRLRRRTFATASLGLAAASMVRAPASGAEFTWKLGFSTARDHPIAVRMVEAAAGVRKETGGAFDIQVFPNSALGSDTAVLGQLRAGAIEMIAQGGGPLESVVPMASIPSVAYVFNDRPTAFRAMDGELGRLLRAEIASKGIFALERVYESGFRHLTTSTHPVHVPADLQGMRLRIPPSKLYLDTFRSLGASPTGVELGELYTALQTHVVDGQETPLLFIASLRYYEVQKYCSLSRHMWSGYWVLMNQQKWDALPREFQDSLRKHFNAGALLQRNDTTIQERSVRDKLERLGLKFNDIDFGSFKAKLASTGYYARWRNEYGPALWAALERYAGPLG